MSARGTLKPRKKATISLSVAHQILQYVFETALAQAGIHYKGTLPYVNMRAESDTVWKCEVGGNSGRLYLTSKAEGPFWGTERAEFDRLAGVSLSTPKTVQLRIKLGNRVEGLPDFLEQHAAMANIIVYELMRTVWNDPSMASSACTLFQKYPVVSGDGGEIKLTYTLTGMGLGEVALWYSLTNGFTKASVTHYGVIRTFVCEFSNYEWTETTPSGMRTLEALNSSEDFRRMLALGSDGEMVVISGGKPLEEILTGVKLIEVLGLGVGEGRVSTLVKIERPTVNTVCVTYRTKQEDKTLLYSREVESYFVYELRVSMVTLLHFADKTKIL